MKIQTIIRVAAAILLIFSLTSCYVRFSANIKEEFKKGMKETTRGNGEMVTKTFGLDAFDKIQNNTFIDITFGQGDEYSATLSMESNIIDDVSLVVVDNELRVSFENSSIASVRDPELRITAPSLKALRQDGSGDFLAESLKTGSDLEINASGSGDIELRKISVATLTISSVGSGDIDLENIIASSIMAMTKGSGDLEASGISADIVSLETFGSGDATLGGETKLLTLSSHGSGDINAKEMAHSSVTTDNHGSGDIRL